MNVTRLANENTGTQCLYWHQQITPPQGNTGTTATDVTSSLSNTRHTSKKYKQLQGV